MPDENIRMTEGERIDFNRRTDIARSTISMASRAMGRRLELEKGIASAKKNSSSYWIWIVGVAGFAIHYLSSESEYKFGLGGFFVLMAVLYWGLYQFEISRLNGERSRCLDQLTALSATWESATGSSDSFWQICKFDSDLPLDLTNELFSDWWVQQEGGILLRVCELDKARALSEQREQKHNALKAYMARSKM